MQDVHDLRRRAEHDPGREVTVPEKGQQPPLARAIQMLERIAAVSAAGSVPDKLPALQFTVQLATAYALVGIGHELAAIHDQLCDIEIAYRDVNGMPFPGDDSALEDGK